MKKLIYFLVVTGLMLNAIEAPAQSQGKALIDSLLTELSKSKNDTGKVKMLNSLGRISLDINEYDEALKYGQFSLSLSEKLHLKKGQGDAYGIIAMAKASKGDYLQAMDNYEIALKISQETGDKKGMAKIYNDMGIVYSRQNRYPEGLKMFLAALKINEEMDNKAWLANNYDNIGLVYRSQGNYSEALKMSFTALKIYEAIDDKKNIAGCYNNIGLLYWTQKDYDGALQTYSKVLKILGELKDTLGMNDPYNNIAGIYTDMGNYPGALNNYFLSLKIREQMGDKNLIADSYAGIGGVYQKMNNNTEALNKFNAALKLYDELGNKYGIAGIYGSLGETDMALRNLTGARDLFDKALALYKEESDPSTWYYIYKDLATLDSANANYKTALKNYKMYIVYRDSTVNQENNKKLVQTQMQYDFDKKDAATKAEQNKKDALAKAELQKQKLVRNGFIGGFAVVLLFAGVFFTQRNKIRKGKKRSDELLLNILPLEVAEELKAKGSTEAKQFDDVTVMFTDFKNFTQISERLSPSELVAEIHTCFKAFDNIIGKHNIEKIKTIGDSYMCAGGLPVVNTTNATDVVNAALEIQQFMQEYLQQRKKEGKEIFEMRIGIHTGPVVAGIVGVKKFAYDIWGDTVNIASRMESSGEAGKVNISGYTYEFIKDKFDCIYRGKILAKNKGEIDMYFVETIK